MKRATVSVFLLLLIGPACSVAPVRVVEKPIRENVHAIEVIGGTRFESYASVETKFHERARALCKDGKYENTLLRATNDGSADRLALASAAGGGVAAALTPGFEPLVVGEVYCAGAAQSIVLEAKNGNRIRVLGLVQAGASIDAVDSNGRTALMYASGNGHKEVAKDLLASHANVNIRDAEGRSAADLARTAGHAEIVELLVGAGAS